MADSKDWVCSRFYGDTTKGLDAGLLTLLNQMRRVQAHGLYPLPAGAAVFLFLCWLGYYLARDHSERIKGYCTIGLWISAAIGFSAAVIPMTMGNVLMVLGPIYASKTQTRFRMGNIVLTWMGFGFHLAYILSAQWYHRHIGGAGNYEGGTFGLGGVLSIAAIQSRDLQGQGWVLRWDGDSKH